MAECPDRGRTGVYNLDALRARVKDVGGGSFGTARVLYEIAMELDAVELERDGNDDDSKSDGEEPLDVFEHFFLTERDEIPEPDFRPPRA
jgi:hypothetical protein